jgi:hypothetical protein
MTGRAGARLSRARGLQHALAQLAVAAVILAGVEAALLVAGPLTPTWVGMLFPVGAGVYLAVGLLAWLRRPSNRMGSLLSAGGLVWLAAGLANTDLPELIAVGQILATAPLAIVVHLLVAFPSGRLATSGARALVAVAYFTAIVLQAPCTFSPATRPRTTCCSWPIARTWCRSECGCSAPSGSE